MTPGGYHDDNEYGVGGESGDRKGFFEGSSQVVEKTDKTPMNSGKIYVLKKSRLEKHLSLYLIQHLYGGKILEIQDGNDLLRLYKDGRSNFSCQSFILHHLPGKDINLERLLTELKGDLKIEETSAETYKVFDEFKDEHGNLVKKIAIADIHLIDEHSGLMLITHETEHHVFFRDEKYLFLETNFILSEVELIEGTYYFYIFSKRNLIKTVVDILSEKVTSIGLQMGELLLSTNALYQLHEELGGNLTQFSLINVSPRLKKLSGSGTELQDDDTFKDLKDRSTTEVYRYLFEINRPSSDSNLDKLTVSIVRDCFVHSYHHITYKVLLDFVKSYVIPKATAKITVQHPLSAYDKLEIYETDYSLDEEEL